MRGPKPKQTNRRLKLQAGRLLPGIPDPPEWLDELARDKWRELCPLLQELGTLATVSLDHVATYCEAFSRWRKAELEIQKTGEVVTHHNGVSGLSHWVKVSQQAQDAMYRAGAELGLNPSCRGKLTVSTQQERPSRFFAKIVS